MPMMSRLLIPVLRVAVEVTEEPLGTPVVMHKILILIIFIPDLALIAIK